MFQVIKALLIIMLAPFYENPVDAPLWAYGVATLVLLLPFIGIVSWIALGKKK